MKKVASIVAVVLFAVGLFATQADSVLDFDIESAWACSDCSGDDDPRGGTA